MSRALRFSLVAAAVMLCALPLARGASVTALPPGRTGGFGERTCQQCHWEGPLNDPAGRLGLDGIPERYTPGKQYLITITVSHPELGRAGFQLSARQDDGSQSPGVNAGTLAVTDERAEAVEANGVTYVQHSPEGVELQDGRHSASWQIRWTAPASGSVLFHAAANAANGDDSPLGDSIYTGVTRSRPR